LLGEGGFTNDSGGRASVGGGRVGDGGGRAKDGGGRSGGAGAEAHAAAEHELARAREDGGVDTWIWRFGTEGEFTCEELLGEGPDPDGIGAKACISSKGGGRGRQRAAVKKT
jgi:hypothetical protein